jgi:hypothetical protein
MATEIIPDEATKTRLNAIEDLRDRLIAAATTLGEARTHKADRRFDRTVGAAVLHNRYGPDSANEAKLREKGWTKAAIYNDLFGIARPQLDRDLSRITVDIPDLTEAQALAKAKKNHEEWIRQRSIEDAAYPIFVDMIHSLARRNHKGQSEIEGISNADLARLSGRSTARIAQILNGSTNTSRAARREREKRQAKEESLKQASGL